MMGCLFACFRSSGGGGSHDGQLVSPAPAPAAHREDGGAVRRPPPSRNALSAVFLREDEEGSRMEQTASSWIDKSHERKRTDQELEHEDIMQKSCGSALVETTDEIQRALEDVNSIHQRRTDFMEGMKVEYCETPSRSHQTSTVLDAISACWKGCDASSQHGAEAVSKSIDVESVKNESLKDCRIELIALDSSFICNNDIYLVGSTSSPFTITSTANDELQTPATCRATNLEELANVNNTEACVHDEYPVLDPAKDFKECGISREEFFQPEQSDEDPKCTKNDQVVSMEISISDECSIFQSSEGSVSSFNKIRDGMNATSMEKSLTTASAIHATREVVKDTDSEMELPSLAQWLKPPKPKKTFRDEALIGDRSHSAKNSDEGRPIIGMVAAHWKDKEQVNFTPKWWDGNGIPNSTNKYKEDQKVSWHATPFEERLEKALSEEKLLSERNCSSGKTSQFLGVEGEESDTAESNRLCAAAYA